MLPSWVDDKMRKKSKIKTIQTTVEYEATKYVGITVEVPVDGLTTTADGKYSESEIHARAQMLADLELEHYVESNEDATFISANINRLPAGVKIAE